MDRTCYLAGEWTSDGQIFEVISPDGGKPVGLALRPSAAVAEKAVESAAGARSSMKEMPSWKKEEILERTAASLERSGEEFARLISGESGKPLRYSRGEVARAVRTFREASQECSRLYGETIPLDATGAGEGRVGIVGYFPLGPVLAITPFNFPLNLVAHKLAPAIAAGCPVILKPSSATPLTALRLAEVLGEAGLPAGALSVLPMTGEQAGALAEDPRIRKVTFTGSAAVGWDLKRRACMKKVTLELGGNAAAAVDADWPDLAGAAARIVTGGYAFSGQVCISVQRVYVHVSRYEAFLEEFVPRVSSLARGPVLDETTDIGPMIDEAEARRVEEWVGEAVAGGAGVVTGGSREGNYYHPTIIVGAGRGMKVVDEEVFGPLTVVSSYEDFDTMIAEVNDPRFGLQAGLFVRDIGKIRRAFSRLEVGGVIQGDCPTFRVDRMPYGGVKGSGYGREGLRWAIRDMCEQRLLVLTS